MCVMSIKCRDESGSAMVNMRPDYDDIELPAHELVILCNTNGDWAEEMEQEIQFTREGECRPATYSPVPSPAPWYPTHPPTSKYTHTHLPTSGTTPHAHMTPTQRCEFD
jgi:hypothetical protein